MEIFTITAKINASMLQQESGGSAPSGIQVAEHGKFLKKLVFKTIFGNEGLNNESMNIVYCCEKHILFVYLLSSKRARKMCQHQSQQNA